MVDLPKKEDNFMKTGTKKTKKVENQKCLIVALAGDYLKIQHEKLDPIFETIEKRLLLHYPKLSNYAATDWTCDLVSCSNSEEIKLTLKRLEDFYGLL